MLPTACLVGCVHLSCVARELLGIKFDCVLVIRRLATVELKARPLLAIVRCLRSPQTLSIEYC